MKTVIIASMFLSVLSVNLARAEAVAPARAAELSVHRIEKLVTLKKVDENFMKNFYGMSITRLSPTQPADPAFKATIIQVPGADGKSHQCEILMDANGKALNNVVKTGSDSVNAPAWPAKDALSLTENSMHYVLENGPSNPKVKPFFTGFTNLVLTQFIENGQAMSRASIRSSETKAILEVVLKADGTFVSANFTNL